MNPALAVNLVHPDLMDAKAIPVTQAPLDLGVKTVCQAKMGIPVHPAPLVLPEFGVKRVLLGHPAKMANAVPKVGTVPSGIPEPTAKTDLPVLKVNPARMVLPVNPVIPVLLELVVHLEKVRLLSVLKIGILNLIFSDADYCHCPKRGRSLVVFQQ